MKSKLLKLIRRYQSEGEPITIRALSLKLRRRQKDVLQMCEDEGLCINVGAGVPGGGSFRYKNIGDYSVEDLQVLINRPLGIRGETR